MKANSSGGQRRAFLAALSGVWLASFGAAKAGSSPLEGEWGGLDARGATAQVIVTAGKIDGFFWGGDYRQTGLARVYDNGARIDSPLRPARRTSSRRRTARVLRSARSAAHPCRSI